MKKLLAILVAAMMLFGIFGGALAQTAALRSVSGEKAGARVSDPLIEKKTSKATRDLKATLDEALNAAGGTIAFVSEGSYPWRVVTDDETGRIYAQSTNEGVTSSSSVVSATVQVGSNKAIAFEFKAWGEGNSSPYDKCIFAIDGNAQFTYGARDNDWEEYVGNIGPGTHTLTWEYSKDSSVNPTGDYFAVDNIEIIEREAVPVNTEITEAINVEGGNIQFVSGGDYPWEVVTEEGGRTYAKNGNSGVHSSTSELTATVMADEVDILAFEFKAWGEGTSTFWDHCDFYVDNVRIMYYGAYNNAAWETFTCTLSAGEHELKWSFTKDSTDNGAGDYFCVDNVSIAQAVSVESISAPERMEIPQYGAALIEYTVLPANATNKTVTFASADPNIAAVDQNGMVRGVGIGDTIITITSAADPSVTAQVAVKVIESDISAVNIYGSIVYDPDQVIADQWVTFPDIDPTVLSILGDAPEIYGAAYAYGTVYGYTSSGGYFFAIPFDDLANSENYVGSTTMTSLTVRSMSFDYTSGMLYGIASDSSNAFCLVAVDMASGALETVGGIDVTMLAFAIDINGNAYGVASGGNLYAVDLETAALTLVGSTGQSVSYVQDMAFDYDTGTLYWAHCNDTDGDLFVLDPTDASCYKIGNIGPGAGCELVGMFIVPESEPELPGDIPVTGVSIIPVQAEIRVGDTAGFTAAVSPVN
ncbi:MAG: Ig-like domain-containing protein, partial [Clostridia bacterium]|nr:Ig-like domain-containing protein [Clostridia bacterium]